MERLGDVRACGIEVMQEQEMREINGGLIGWIIGGAALLLLSSCNTQVNVQVGDTNHNATDFNARADSTSVDVTPQFGPI